jgi:hypothetical protein
MSGIETDLVSLAVFCNVDVENVHWQNLAIINIAPCISESCMK